MTVETILRDVLDREGWPTYTEHPADRGGATKGGITLRTLQSWRRRPVSLADLRELQKDEALAILRRRYVETNGIHKLEGHPIHAQLVDNAVLSGPTLAVKDLQRVLRVKRDGIVGPVTRGACEAADAESLDRRCAVVRALRLGRHVQAHPDQIVFLSGWLKRALSFV